MPRLFATGKGDLKLVSIAASHLYMFLAFVTIGALLISTFNSYSTILRSVPEQEQLKNLLERIVSEGNELLTLTLITNSNESLFLDLPSKIGYNQYWMRIRNDSAKAWVEGCFGQIWNGKSAHKVTFPCQFSASGCFLSGYGVAKLECYLNNSVPQLCLSSKGGA